MDRPGRRRARGDRAGRRGRVQRRERDPLLSLDRSVLDRPVLEAAPLLLGAVLRRESPEGTVAVRLTEVEAYSGEGGDPGSHAHRGRTRRNEVMFGPSGHLYTYFTYGMHTCGNIVCLPEGAAAGVLLRGGEIVEGEQLARARRGESVAVRDLARGPARLAVALGILLADGGADVFAGAPYSLEFPARRLPFATSPRTGVSGDGGTDAFLWRFFLPDDSTVSPYRRSVPRKR